MNMLVIGKALSKPWYAVLREESETTIRSPSWIAGSLAFPDLI
jgi:hypothetical protein